MCIRVQVCVCVEWVTGVCVNVQTYVHATEGAYASECENVGVCVTSGVCAATLRPVAERAWVPGHCREAAGVRRPSFSSRLSRVGQALWLSWDSGRSPRGRSGAGLCAGRTRLTQAPGSSPGDCGLDTFVGETEGRAVNREGTRPQVWRETSPFNLLCSGQPEPSF